MLGDFPSAAKLDSNFCDVARHRDVDWAEFHVVLISSAGIVLRHMTVENVTLVASARIASYQSLIAFRVP